MPRAIIQGAGRRLAVLGAASRRTITATLIAGFAWLVFAIVAAWIGSELAPIALFYWMVGGDVGDFAIGLPLYGIVIPLLFVLGLWGLRSLIVALGATVYSPLLAVQVVEPGHPEYVALILIPGVLSALAARQIYRRDGLPRMPSLGPDPSQAAEALLPFRSHVLRVLGVVLVIGVLGLAALNLVLRVAGT
jgi:hypothetical protein